MVCRVYCISKYIREIFFLEVLRDMTGYHGEKIRRVQRKVDNLRKAASSLYSMEDCLALSEDLF